MKVDFMIIGAMKCGTSTLAQILANHPQVSFCKRKEPHFFSQNPNWKESVDKYHSLFDEKEGVIYGEGSTTYTFAPQFNPLVWEDIYEYNPKMKFIYIIRNPIDRLVSQYVHMYEKGVLKQPIERAIRNEASLINNSRYYTQILPYINKFSFENLLLLDFDDIIKNMDNVLSEVADFLGIEKYKFPESDNVHANESIGHYKMNYQLERLVKKFTKSFSIEFKAKIASFLFKNKKSRLKEKPILSAKDVLMLENLLRFEVKGIEQLTGKDFSKWMK